MKTKTEAQVHAKTNARKTYNKNRKCSACGEKILTRPYVEPSTGPIHEACWNKTFV